MTLSEVLETVAAQTDPLLLALIAIGGVVLGAILAGGFTLLTGHLQARREKARWLLETRLAAYADYLHVIRATVLEVSANPMNPIGGDLTKSSAMLSLVASDAVALKATEATSYLVDNMVGETLGGAEQIERLNNVDTLVTELATTMADELAV